MEKYPKISPIEVPNRQWPNKVITEAPVWASVDLRDGNQALPVPMNPAQKLEYFNMLLNISIRSDFYILAQLSVRMNCCQWMNICHYL